MRGRLGFDCSMYQKSFFFDLPSFQNMQINNKRESNDKIMPPFLNTKNNKKIL